jgi:hypothetical protein
MATITLTPSTSAGSAADRLDIWLMPTSGPGVAYFNPSSVRSHDLLYAADLNGGAMPGHLEAVEADVSRLNGDTQ